MCIGHDDGSQRRGAHIHKFFNLLRAVHFIKIPVSKLHKSHMVHPNTHTHKHIHADENNTCPKTKFLGQVIMVERLFD